MKVKLIRTGEIKEVNKEDICFQHRIMCGDSTKEEDVAKLMNGQKANMIFTDPPYNVSFKSRNVKGSYSNNIILNDDIDSNSFENLIKLSFNNIKENKTDEAHIYICCNYRCFSLFEKYFKNSFKTLNNVIVWVKGINGLGSAYRNKHEFIIFGGDFTNCVFENKSESNVWEYHSPNSFAFRNEELNGKSVTLSPTMKPIALIERAINNSSIQGDLILDLFLGSGSTLIACEHTNRICYGMELDPIYCEIICQRWENLTGKKRIKIN